ncbi:MAG: serine hydrolase domain-containing protein [Promethearchaeota archaeon]
MSISLFIMELVFVLSLCGMSYTLIGTGFQNGMPSITESKSISTQSWPTDGWLVSTPEEQGVDSNRLGEMMDYIRVNDIDIDSVLVVKRGHLIFEEYLSSLYTSDTKHSIHSCTKSFTSALVGIAIQEGYIGSVNDKLVDYFQNRTIANLDTRKQSITIEHLLTMTSGLEWDEWSLAYGEYGNDATDMFRSSDAIQYVLDRPMAHDPGESWTYNSGGSHILGAIVATTSGQTLYEFAFEQLFEPLGILDYNLDWYRDQNGYYSAGGGLSMRPRDMAKFGHLFLNNGTWDNQQILPAEWVEKSVQTSFIFSEYSGYGYQWWTNPTDAASVYSAQGYAGQFIFVIPSLDMVVVFTSGVPPYELHPHTSMLFEYIIPAATESNMSTVPIIDSITLVLLVVVPVPALLAGVYWNLKMNRGPNNGTTIKSDRRN